MRTIPCSICPRAHHQAGDCPKIVCPFKHMSQCTVPQIMRRDRLRHAVGDVTWYLFVAVALVIGIVAVVSIALSRLPGVLP